MTDPLPAALSRLAKTLAGLVAIDGSSAIMDDGTVVSMADPTDEELETIAVWALNKLSERLESHSPNQFGLNHLRDVCHQRSVDAGWHDNPREDGTMLMLMVSELAEAMEGERKGLMDDHLPHRPMAEVELVDAIIRIGDYAGMKGYDLQGAVLEKLEYNRHRADHKREHRAKEGGRSSSPYPHTKPHAVMSDPPLRPRADTAVIIGRFQVDELHEGHRALIASVTSEPYRRVIVLLGVAPFASKENPLDFAIRARMIQAEFPFVMVLPLVDTESDFIWSQNLDALLRAAVPHGDVVLFGGRDSFVKHYGGRFKTIELDGGGGQSGSAVRERLRTQVRPTADFRAGVIYAAQNDYDRVMPTVDVAAMKGNRVCLIKKRGETFWRLPGGFVDPADESYEQAAHRELLEETGLTTSMMDYVTSQNVSDWRCTPDRTIATALFACRTKGEPKACDDAEDAMFVPLDNPVVNIMDAHHVLLEHLRSSLPLTLALAD